MEASNREWVEHERNPAVLVSPISSRYFDHDEFADLVLALVQESDLMADAIQIRLGYLYGDSWPPDWTWVNFIVNEVGEAAIDAIVLGIIAWGGRWIRKKREEDPEAAPIKAIIYGPDGEVLREVEVRDGDDA